MSDVVGVTENGKGELSPIIDLWVCRPSFDETAEMPLSHPIKVVMA